MRTLKAGFLYFLIALAAGFVLGVVRELWAVPRFGVRMAELIEAPVMLAVLVFAAYWVIARLGLSPAAPVRIGMGFVALVLLLAAEAALVVSLRGLTIEQYIAARDPVSGAVYVLMLLIYAAMPMIVMRR